MSALMRARLPQMETPPPAYAPVEGYRALALAILKQALQDAAGTVFAPGPQAPDQVQAEAVAWLQDADAIADLVELAGYDGDVVLRRVRHVLQESVPTVAASQLRLL